VGIDTVARVERDITARGGTPLSGGTSMRLVEQALEVPDGELHVGWNSSTPRNPSTRAGSGRRTYINVSSTWIVRDARFSMSTEEISSPTLTDPRMLGKSSTTLMEVCKCDSLRLQATGKIPASRLENARSRAFGCAAGNGPGKHRIEARHRPLSHHPHHLPRGQPRLEVTREFARERLAAVTGAAIELGRKSRADETLEE
jgi:hypothetical protein